MERKIGDVYIKENACPNCGSDLEIIVGVSEMCVNWQHPHMPEVYYKGGFRNCDYALLAG